MSSPVSRSSERRTRTVQTNASRQMQGSSQPNRSYNNSPALAAEQLSESMSHIFLAESRAFDQSLDAQVAEQERLHREALAQARREHEAIREAAERARERVELEIQKANRLRAEAEQRKLLAEKEELRKIEERTNHEIQRRMQEEKKIEEERQRRVALERERRETEERADRQKQREKDEHAARTAQREKDDRDEADRKAKEAELAKSQAQQRVASQPAQMEKQSNTTPIPSTTAVTTAPAAPLGFTSSLQDREAVHQSYLALHKRLKEMRQLVPREFGKTPHLKSQLSEWRRTIKSKVSQTMKRDRVANKEARDGIDRVLSQAAKIGEPSVDISNYIVTRPGDEPIPPTHGSGVLLFLLNHFAKAVINSIVQESAVDTEMADSIGILTTWLFSKPEYCLNGRSLIDVFWAKYRVLCPALFGISGSETTQAGRLRIGWRKEDDVWISEQEHYTRMIGLGTGFSAITLRDFSKSRNQNPAPNRLFWESLSRILNTPPSNVQPTHCVLVKNMIEHYVGKILTHFGHAGLVAIRTALVAFPKKGPKRKDGTIDPSATALETLALKIQHDLHLLL